MQTNPYQAPQSDSQKSHSSNGNSTAVHFQLGFITLEIGVYLITAVYFYAAGDLQKSAGMVFVNWAIISVGFVFGIRSNSLKFTLSQVALFFVGVLQLFTMLLYASVDC